MTKVRDLHGEVFGRLTVVARHPENTSEGKARWICQCQCGATHVALGANLVKGFTRSCGCFHRDDVAKRSTKHGHARRKNSDPTYRSWCSMLTRCRNTNFSKYKRYGALGVTVHPSWNEYEQFLKDMGPRPKGTSLDRIDPYGNYEPGNCRWATPIVQAFNQRRHHLPPDER